VIERPRQCIFVGTTNPNDYLKDPTGGRRFLPATVTKIDLEGLQRDRDQLWAEARICFEEGVPWWFTEVHADAAVTAKEEQEARYQEDAWEQPIGDYLESRLHRPPDDPAYRVTIGRIFKDALDIADKSRWDQRAKNSIARCLKRLGWKKKQIRVRIAIQGKTVSKPRWFYVREPTELELSQDTVADSKAEEPAATPQENRCNQSDAEVIDLKQAAERTRTAT
jgi:predicted P-loop ATPase